MIAIEAEILATLVDLERTAVAARAGQPGAGILPILEKLDRLAVDLPADAPGDLRHYLQRKSYEKARLFLEGRAGECTSGSCGR